MKQLVLLLLVSCGGDSGDGFRSKGLEITGIDRDQNVAVGDTLDLVIQASGSFDDMPGDPQITLLIICNGTKVHGADQQPSDNRAEFAGIKITDKFNGRCVVSASYKYGFKVMSHHIDFTVGQGNASNRTPCIDLADLKIYLGKQVNICDKKGNIRNFDSVSSLQCGAEARAINLHSDLGLPKHNDSVGIVIIANGSVPSDCKITIDNQSFPIIKPPTSGAGQNLAKDLITSVTTEDDRIKVNLKNELDDTTGLFISPDSGDGLSNQPNTAYDWHKIASGGVTDFGTGYVTNVMVLTYKKSDKGVWWDYFQQEL